MKLIVCLDDKNGMMFNHRRQSKDRKVREDMLKLVGDGVLWMNAYSYGQFEESLGAMHVGTAKIQVAETFLEQAKDGQYCFVEDRDIAGLLGQTEEIVVYRWNRTYPADVFCTASLQGWTLADQTEFAGFSHQKITRETYIK